MSTNLFLNFRNNPQILPSHYPTLASLCLRKNRDTVDDLLVNNMNMSDAYRNLKVNDTVICFKVPLSANIIADKNQYHFGLAFLIKLSKLYL
jgi:hypothetical protein